MNKLSVIDIAARGHVSSPTVYRWIKCGILPNTWVIGKNGRKHYEYDEAYIDEFLKNRGSRKKPITPVVNQTKIEDCYPFNLMQLIIDQCHLSIEIWDLNVREFLARISELSEKDRTIIVMRFKDGLSLDEVGGALHVSREYVRQIQLRAMRKLEHRVRCGYCATVPKSDLIAANTKIAALEETIKSLSDKLDEKQTSSEYQKSVSLSDMDINIRTYNCLRRAGLDTLNDIIRFDTDQRTKTPEEMKEAHYRFPSWMHIRNFGRRSYEDLKQKMYELTGYMLVDFDFPKKNGMLL